MFLDNAFLDDNLKFACICLVTNHGKDTVSLEFLSTDATKMFRRCLDSEKDLADFIYIVSQNHISLWDEVLPENLRDIFRENKVYNGLTLFRSFNDTYDIIVSIAMKTPIDTPSTCYLNIMHSFKLIMGHSLDFYIDLFKNKDTPKQLIH